jgi:pantetheine-phosphate adenylyltransferase
MHVAVAGTFGPIHDGHRALFEEALRHGDDEVIVALTSDDLAEQTRHEPRPVPPFAERERRVREELAALDRWDRDVTVEKLHDQHGLAVDDPTLDYLVVSPETVSELEAINDARRDRGFDPITAIVVPYALAEDGERISSTRIVKDEIDEHGNLSSQ